MLQHCTGNNSACQQVLVLAAMPKLLIVMCMMRHDALAESNVKRNVNGGHKWTTCNGPAVAGLDEWAAFGVDLRVRHVENLLLTIFNLMCGESAAASKRSSQSRRRTSCTAAAEPLAEWRARALAVAAAAAGAAGGGAGCTAVVVTCSSCPLCMHNMHMHAYTCMHTCTYTCTIIYNREAQQTRLGSVHTIEIKQQTMVHVGGVLRPADTPKST